MFEKKETIIRNIYRFPPPKHCVVGKSGLTNVMPHFATCHVCVQGNWTCVLHRSSLEVCSMHHSKRRRIISKWWCLKTPDVENIQVEECYLAWLCSRCLLLASYNWRVTDSEIGSFPSRRRLSFCI